MRPQHSLRAPEIATVLVLTVLSFWAVRPLLEEWSLMTAFRVFGLSYIQVFATAIPMRPLHLVPAALQWLLGNGQPIGVAASACLMFLLRYLVARWAVTPLMTGQARWVVATMAAVLLAWPGAWLGRFGSAQATAVLLFAILGFCIRLHLRWSWKWALASVVSLTLLCCIYQALALCLVALPLLALLWRPLEQQRLRTLALAGPLRVAGVLVAGFAMYGAYALTITRILGNAGYEAGLAGSAHRLLTARGLWAHIAQAYATAFGSGSHLLPLMLAIAIVLLAPAIALPARTALRRRLVLLALALVLALPLLSLIYVSEAHIRDIDRVLFPLTCGFVLVCASLLAWLRTDDGVLLQRGAAASVVALLLLSALISAADVRQYWRVQRTVINQTVAAVKAHPAGSVLLVDTTGTLGDVYTLVNPTLTDALANRGVAIPAAICTPEPIDRVHPVARRYPIETTPRCDKAPAMAAPTLVLTAGWDNGVLVIKP